MAATPERSGPPTRRRPSRSGPRPDRLGHRGGGRAGGAAVRRALRRGSRRRTTTTRLPGWSGEGTRVSAILPDDVLSGSAIDVPRPLDASTPVGIYGLGGVRVAGEGPIRAGLAAAVSRTAREHGTGRARQIVVAVPLRTGEGRFAAVRAVASSEVRSRIVRSWLLMVILAAYRCRSGSGPPPRRSDRGATGTADHQRAGARRGRLQRADRRLGDPGQPLGCSRRWSACSPSPWPGGRRAVLTHGSCAGCSSANPRTCTT